MKKNLQWKIILVLAIIALSVFLAYPPGKKIQYGLDLQGGMHLVLQVVTDDAINTETDQEIIRIFYSYSFRLSFHRSCTYNSSQRQLGGDSQRAENDGAYHSDFKYQYLRHI